MKERNDIDIELKFNEFAYHTYELLKICLSNRKYVDT